jgi:hypothetical protein
MNTQEHANTRESCNKNIVNARQKIENIQQNISQENTNNTKEIIGVIYTLADKNVADQDTKEQCPSLHHQYSDTNFRDPSQNPKTSSGVTTAGATTSGATPAPHRHHSSANEEKIEREELIETKTQTMNGESFSQTLSIINRDIDYVDNVLLRRQNRLDAKEEEVKRNSGTKYDY